MNEDKNLKKSSAKEYDRFREFTRRLIAVPKSEIDKTAKRMASQKTKAKRIPKPESK